MRYFYYLIRISSLAILIFSGESLAYDDNSITEQEIRMLPPYCQAQKFIASEIKGKAPQQIENDHRRWQNLLGKTYEHVHHYCWALNNINRYYKNFRSSAADRSNYLESAIGDFSYVIGKAPDTFPLLPDILTARGKAFTLLERYGDAIRDLQKAIKLKPKFDKPYASLADIHVKLGQLAEARGIILKGLSYAPQSKLLLKRSKELGTNSKQMEPASNMRQSH